MRGEHNINGSKLFLLRSMFRCFGDGLLSCSFFILRTYACVPRFEFLVKFPLGIPNFIGCIADVALRG